MVSDAQKKATELYRRANVKQVTIRFYPAETEIWEWLQAQPNKRVREGAYQSGHGPQRGIDFRLKR